MKLLVTGASGMLARAVAQVAERRGHEVVRFGRARLDVTDAPAVARTIESVRPDAVLHCAGYTRVDDAESDAAAAHAVNAAGAGNVARACAAVNATMVYPGTDYVFDGTASRPYRPDDATSPINEYGRSKLAGEHAAATSPKHLVVRTSWLYGQGGRHFVGTVIERARNHQPLRIVNDQIGSPTWTADLAGTMLLLLERNAPAGVYHAAGKGQCSWFELGLAALQMSGIDADVQPIATSEMPRPAQRPAYSVLDCSTTEAIVGALPEWRVALARALEAGL